jgi:LysW-gamma-L-lysine carboxypeptidase
MASDMLVDLLKVYSPSGKEKKAIEILKEYADNLGYEEIVIDEMGNLIASYGQGVTKFAVIGHIDTIPWELPVYFDGISIHGRGAVDAKGPLVAAYIGLALAKNLVDKKKAKVYAIALVDEERDSIGAKHLVNSGFKLNGAIISEPSNTDGVVVGYRGSARFSIVCQGPGGHSSSGTEHSACEKLVSIWMKLKSVYSNSNSVLNSTPALLKLCCGEDASIVPRYGEALVSIRIALNSNVEEVIKTVESVVKGFDNCTIKTLDYTKPVKVSIGNIAARALVRAILRNNLKPRILNKLGTSDLNILYPTVTENIVAYGPGKSELAHTDRESITIDELCKGISIYHDTVKEFLKLVK